MRAQEFVQEYTVKQNSRFLRLDMDRNGVYTAKILTPGGERLVQDNNLKRLEQTVKLKYNLEPPAGYRLGEDKIKISTDPGWLGAEVGNYKAKGPVVNIAVNKLVGLEPDEKMKDPASRKNLKNMMASIESGEKMPPILVRKLEDGYYQILDGHHRFHAYKLLDKPAIPAQIVPDEDIDLNEQQLNELTFMGMSQCTKDCSGHRAGYAWSKARGGAHAASWSPSFNKGAEIAAAGY